MLVRKIDVFGSSTSDEEDRLDSLGEEDYYQKALKELKSDNPTSCLKTMDKLLPKKDNIQVKEQIRDICKQLTSLVYPVRGSGSAFDRLHTSFRRYGYDGVADMIRTYNKILEERPEYREAFSRRRSARKEGGSGSGSGLKPIFASVKEDVYDGITWVEFSRLAFLYEFKILWEGNLVYESGVLFRHNSGVLLWVVYKDTVVKMVYLYAQINYSPVNEQELLVQLEDCQSWVLRRESYRMYRVFSCDKPSRLFSRLRELSRIVSFPDKYDTGGRDTIPLFVFPLEIKESKPSDLARLSRLRMKEMTREIQKMFYVFW